MIPYGTIAVRRLICWLWRHRFERWAMLEVSADAFDMVIICERCGEKRESHFHK